MIPILYASNETEFTTNGLGGLPDAIECTVTEERNGIYELFMRYPIDGRHFDDLAISKIICAVPADGKASQPFRIYEISKPLNGICSIYAEHISYQLNFIPVMPFTASTCTLALTGLVENSAQANPFTVWTDKSVTADFAVTYPMSFKSLLGGVSGSLLDVYGTGEYEYDNWLVRLWLHRGTNSGVTLRYGKNITELEQDETIANTITGICPYWINTESGECVTLPEYAIWSANASNYPYPRTITVDFSDKFETEPTEDQLRSAAEAYITANDIGVPKTSVKVSFMPLTQAKGVHPVVINPRGNADTWIVNEEDYSMLERVNLCDTVTVIYSALGVSCTAEVIKTVYNVLLDRYDSIEIGDARSTLASTITNITTETKNTVTNAVSGLKTYVNHATDMLAGGLGGHVVINRNANGEPNEILIMDTDDITTAVNVIRMNNAGIGFSQNGYDGVFESAWLIDGTFNADFIRAGTMSANLIQGGILKLGSADDANGTLEVFDASNNKICVMDNTGLKVYGADGSYVIMNATEGFAGYDAQGTKIYWASSQEFHMLNAEVVQEFTLASTLRYLPIQTASNRGVGLVPYVEGDA